MLPLNAVVLPLNAASDQGLHYLQVISNFYIYTLASSKMDVFKVKASRVRSEGVQIL